MATLRPTWKPFDDPQMVRSAHVRNARAFENIRAAAEYFGVHVSETDWHDLMRG
jgi:hypothetical protein